jgi:hypothetical protein
VNFYPLAEINNEANLPFDETAINATTDNFQKSLLIGGNIRLIHEKHQCRILQKMRWFS